MRALIQRVPHAQVDVDGRTVGSIGTGLLILLGVGTNDTEAQVDKLWGKISKMRIFEDKAGKTNLSLADVSGEVLVVSQFTLYGDCKKGRRPSFVAAARPETAVPLYEYFIDAVKRQGVKKVATGQFGADMQVYIQNDGPVTLMLDTDEIMRRGAK